jgi:hypothetical protein
MADVVDTLQTDLAYANNPINEQHGWYYTFRRNLQELFFRKK